MSQAAKLIPPLQVRDLGLVPYEEAYALQKSAVEQVLNGQPEVLFLCEHPAVLTLGRLANKANVLFPKDELERRGIDVLAIDRGGDVTLHAPGQLVVYPILDLNHHGKDLKRYLYKLEEVAIDFLSGFGIVTSRFEGRTGVWSGDKKIASIGVGVRKWVTFHGIGLNINTDLELFRLIRPCAMDVAMTSLKELTGKAQDMGEAKERFAKAFCRHFQKN